MNVAIVKRNLHKVVNGSSYLLEPVVQLNLAVVLHETKKCDTHPVQSDIASGNIAHIYDTLCIYCLLNTEQYILILT